MGEGHRIADVSIEESIDRMVKEYGIEGTEDLIYRVLTHKDLAQMKSMFLNAFYKRYTFLLK